MTMFDDEEPTRPYPRISPLTQARIRLETLTVHVEERLKSQFKREMLLILDILRPLLETLEQHDANAVIVTEEK
jgi:hypothetical protein